MIKIIWVDDDINRPELRAEKDELSERGCEIIAVQGADSFLEMLRDPRGNFDCDCIILDLSMPVGSEFSLKDAEYGSRTGILLMKRIRDSFLFSKVKIIIYSIVDNDEVFKECKNAGALYLKKANFLYYEFADEVMKFVKSKQ